MPPHARGAPEPSFVLAANNAPYRRGCRAFAIAVLANCAAGFTFPYPYFQQTEETGSVPPEQLRLRSLDGEPPVSNVIIMDNRTTKGPSPKAGVRDRRFAIRYPFAADVELIDLETGTQATGVTSDISLGGCFICTSKPLPLQSRVRMMLSRKGQVVKGLAVVRIVKPRIGMGIEFLDVESFSLGILSRWIDQLRQR